MTLLTTFSTARGSKIELFAASAGKINIHVNGNWIGIMENVVDHATHGKVITIVGQSAIIPVGSAAADVAAAINNSAEQAAQLKKQADKEWAAFAQTSEGRIDALMSKIEQQENDN